VSVLYGSSGGLSRAGGQLFTQNSPGVGGGAEALDNFGLPWPAVFRVRDGVGSDCPSSSQLRRRRRSYFGGTEW